MALKDKVQAVSPLVQPIWAAKAQVRLLEEAVLQAVLARFLAVRGRLILARAVVVRAQLLLQAHVAAVVVRVLILKSLYFHHQLPIRMR
jgi:hypothetical protein